MQGQERHKEHDIGNRKNVKDEKEKINMRKETKRGNDREQLFKLIFCDFCDVFGSEKKTKEKYSPATDSPIYSQIRNLCRAQWRGLA